MPRTLHERADFLLDWWAAICQIPRSVIGAHAFSLAGPAVPRHLFRVTAGLDSVILGEAQIVSQIASSLKHSVALHAASPLLKLVFKGAVRAGERARGAVWGRLQAASLGSAAVEAAAAAAGGLSNRNVLIVGAGEMAELVLRSLSAHAPRRITIANRSIDSAMQLGVSRGASVCALACLPAALLDADVVIAATRATLPLIHAQMVGSTMQLRPHRRLTIVDVSLPRNVDSGVRAVAGAELIDIDELGPLVAAAHASRRAVVPAVEAIVEEELSDLCTRLARRVAHARPTVASV